LLNAVYSIANDGSECIRRHATNAFISTTTTATATDVSAWISGSRDKPRTDATNVLSDWKYRLWRACSNDVSLSRHVSTCPVSQRAVAIETTIKTCRFHEIKDMRIFLNQSISVSMWQFDASLLSPSQRFSYEKLRFTLVFTIRFSAYQKGNARVKKQALQRSAPGPFGTLARSADAHGRNGMDGASRMEKDAT
jgi:hypothetical protein